VIEIDILSEVIGQILLLYVSMVINQFWSAALAARYVPGGFNFVESVMIGLGMLGRAELAFVVLNIAYVENKVMNQKCFYVLMITCFLLNITVPLVIAVWRPYYLGEKKIDCIQGEEYQKGGMGLDKGEDDPDHEGATSNSLGSMAEVALEMTSSEAMRPVRHFKFTMTSNGTILAATDQAVTFWGHKHELDMVGSKRVNGGFDCDPSIPGLPNLKDPNQEQEWPHTNIRTLEVDAVGKRSTRRFKATVRRMKVEGSVFQDNLSLRNEKWVFNLSLHDMMVPPEMSPALKAAPAHACIVEMEELTLEKDGTLDWHETARFRKGMEEDVEIDGQGNDT